MYILLAYLARAIGFHFLMLIFMGAAVATRKFRYYFMGAAIQLLPFLGIYSQQFYSQETVTWYWVFYVLSLVAFFGIVSTPKTEKNTPRK